MLENLKENHQYKKLHGDYVQRSKLWLAPKTNNKLRFAKRLSILMTKLKELCNQTISYRINIPYEIKISTGKGSIAHEIREISDSLIPSTIYLFLIDNEQLCHKEVWVSRSWNSWNLDKITDERYMFKLTQGSSKGMWSFSLKAKRVW